MVGCTAASGESGLGLDGGERARLSQAFLFCWRTNVIGSLPSGKIYRYPAARHLSLEGKFASLQASTQAFFSG